mgnify:CR=1 FL=1
MFQVFVDSAANLPAVTAKKYDIHVVSFVNLVNGKELVCFDPDLSPEEELAKGKENVVIICSDHTRPVPSKHIIPFMLKEIREGNPDAKITLLIATGFHRATTRSAVNTISSRIFLIDKLLKSNIFLLLLPYMYSLNFSG